MKKPRVGLLPFYLELYDIKRPERRPRIEGFYGQIASALTDHGLEVSTVPVCRLKPEFNAAIRKFENEEVDAIVTLHMAYSPSLESSAALASTPLPLVVLDTTPTLLLRARTRPRRSFLQPWNPRCPGHVQPAAPEPEGLFDCSRALGEVRRPGPRRRFGSRRRGWQPACGGREWAGSGLLSWAWGILPCPRQN